MWKYKANKFNDPTKANDLIRDYPKLMLNEFGLNSVEGGFYVRNQAEKDNFVLFFKGSNRFCLILKQFLFLITYFSQESKMIKYSETNSFGVYSLPFKMNGKFQFAINTDKQNFSILLDDRLLNFWFDHKTAQVRLKSIESDLKETFLYLLKL